MPEPNLALASHADPLRIPVGVLRNAPGYGAFSLPTHRGLAFAHSTQTVPYVLAFSFLVVLRLYRRRDAQTDDAGAPSRLVEQLEGRP